MRALVTGGAGLIGSHLADLLIERGHEVRIIDNLDPLTHPNGRPPWVNPQAEFLLGDILRRSHEAVHGCDVVFHQAAFGGFAPGCSKATSVNALGTARLLDACRHAGVSRVVVASSQAVYGHGHYYCGGCDDAHYFGAGEREPERLEAGRWEPLCPFEDGAVDPALLRESDLTAPPSVYALSKLYTEQLALLWGAQQQVPVVALRYALTYGPRQSVSNPYTGIASMFATRLLAGQPPVVYEDGLQTRDFTYVGDVARANLLVAEEERAEGVYNVGTGVRTTVLDFAQTLRSALYSGSIDGLYTGPIEAGRLYRPADARHIAVDASRVRALGWEPEVDLHAGVGRYAEWFVESGGGPVVDAEPELRAAGVVRG